MEAGSGPQTAAIIFAGQDPKSAKTEKYDGTTWTEVNSMIQARSILGGAGQGTQTATLAFGGIEPAASDKTESYDGTCWTEVNNLLAAGGYGAGFGTQTAAVYANRYPPDSASVESWDGTSWTEVQNTPYAYSSNCGTGTQTAGLIFAGYYPPIVIKSLLLNMMELVGLRVVISAQEEIMQSGAGTQTSSLCFGGQVPAATVKTEQYNGTAWTEVADLGTAIYSSMPAGTSALAAIAAGGAPGNPTGTEEFTIPDATKTFTAS